MKRLLKYAVVGAGLTALFGLAAFFVLVDIARGVTWIRWAFGS